ncbi:aminopeptidase N [Vibrio splendidus]|uniref:aminopeptidase N n=1 Tax=Vibrio splendidus TaxID=29497 RepID=UPI0024686C20|nr:aminopeptidase N [Vibrio splendidus]MDH5911616.1 aminopeptidase N [Vibrio splendidus]MDH5941947.1 aminopeptidase N [Vibrio splendidus]MDH5985854.1 aminopeptidase N [Vibrio splendidus]MDH5996027.1 aminopeptidase N [Vibrio splendidus]MDH6007425.1 aminopeptidase N [Vibrio splendidus]
MAHTPQAKYRKDYQSPSHTISEIDLTFDLYDSASIITAVSSVKQEKESSTLVLDGEGLKLVSVLVEGTEWTQYEQSETLLTLNDLPKEFTLTIVTEVDPEGNSALEGLYKSGGAFCTQCEAEGFRRITYYMDRPDVLAKFTTTVIADKAENPFLLSNGNRVDEGEAENGRHWVKWQDPHPKPAYLFALVAGDFDVLRDAYTTQSGRNVDLEIFVDKGNLDRANHAMVSLINSMKWDEERFNLEYDLDIYMIVAVDFFNMGAMENKGLNVFNSKFVLANDQTATDTDYLGIEAVIGHEYFHNWTGNRVTCRDWFQLSLKEGLTVFRDQEFSSDLGSRAVNRINNVRIIRGPQFAEDASPMSHPIRPEKVIEMNNFYTLTVYEKGSEVIRMIHTLLGEEGFQKGMKLYFERHDGTAATCEDFVAAMEDASGVDLSQFRLWYSQSGTPTLSVESHYDAEKKEYTLTTRQVTAPTHEQTEKQALHIPLDIELYTASGEVIELQCNGQSIHNVLDVKEAEQTFVFENVSDQPIPSLLREFSAPVKLEYDYSDEELIFLMVNARNEFSRWDAGQMLLAKYIRSNVEKVQQGQEFELSASVVDAFRGVLLSDSLEPAFIAEMLSLPSHNEVSGWYERVDIDAVASVLKAMKVTLAKELEDELAAVYHSHVLTEYTIDHDSIGKRTLRKVCLSYLAHTEKGNDLVVAMYQQANNMTDTMAAMGAANSAQLPCRETLMADYSDKWKHDGLVMDKWFALQGTNPSSNALEVIKASMSHQAFSLKNPNRTRNLVGSFLNMNPVQFHDKSGQGYAFAGEILRELNSSNPQVASRLIDPLLKFRKYDEERQALIKKELETLKNMDNLAKDLFEKVTKALEA